MTATHSRITPKTLTAIEMAELAAGGDAERGPGYGRDQVASYITADGLYVWCDDSLIFMYIF